MQVIGLWRVIFHLLSVLCRQEYSVEWGRFIGLNMIIFLNHSWLSTSAFTSFVLPLPYRSELRPERAIISSLRWAQCLSYCTENTQENGPSVLDNVYLFCVFFSGFCYQDFFSPPAGCYMRDFLSSFVVFSHWSDSDSSALDSTLQDSHQEL